MRKLDSAIWDFYSHLIRDPKAQSRRHYSLAVTICALTTPRAERDKAIAAFAKGMAQEQADLYRVSYRTIVEAAHECEPPADSASEAASLMGKVGGRSRSEAKVAAARLNGRKGGRPRKN